MCMCVVSVSECVCTYFKIECVFGCVCKRDYVALVHECASLRLVSEPGEEEKKDKDINPHSLKV